MPHPAVWFIAYWLLLRFQWPHALGLAMACWAILTLLVVPPLLDKVEKIAKERAVPQAVSGAGLGHFA